MKSHGPDTKGAVFKLGAFNIRELLPATDGCTQRMAGLLHNLGPGLTVEYMGCNQDRGGEARSGKVLDNVIETIVPLDARSFDRIDALQVQAPGDSMMECAFSSVVPPSREYLAQLRSRVHAADIVMLSQPWVYPCIRDEIDNSRQLLVYDAHNVEGFLRRHLVYRTKLGRQVISQLARDEQALCRCADLILACTHNDRLLFHSLFGIDPAKIFVYPNGCFARSIDVTSDDNRRAAKTNLGLDGDAPVAVYIGSNYTPNIHAVTTILDDIAPAVPEVTFLVVGSVRDGIAGTRTIPVNVRMTGLVDETEKLNLLAAADFALNPVETGSGSNIKMFEYMGMGLPIVSTPVGARGVAQRVPPPCVIADGEGLIEATRDLARNADRRRTLGLRARETIENAFAWEKTSAHLGRVLYRHRARLGQSRPRISVLVCTYERHAKLEVLLRHLETQRFKDFEVIVVDQSLRPYAWGEQSTSLDLCYVRKDVPALPAARNTAALYARGDILAFTDDDCEPDEDWLLNAERMFSDDIIGVEGRIVTEVVDGESFRTLTNIGARGLGFMGANLLVRREIFHLIDGFDESFGKFFREDTDFAWRAQALGDICYCEDAVVRHPPVATDSARESASERARFFENDALLLSKHPNRYKELFFFENHWRKNPLFWTYFFQGVERFGVQPPPWIIELYNQNHHESPLPPFDTNHRAQRHHQTVSHDDRGMYTLNEDNNSRRRHSMAYAFYATNDKYAVAVLVVYRLLRRLVVRDDVDFVVLHLGVSPGLLATMREVGMITIECEPLPYVHDEWYRHCLTKLRIFQLTQYKRVIYMDADALPLRSLDELFDLSDDYGVAAPRAYWLDQPWVTSFLIALRPRPDLWRRVEKHFESARETRRYDMEILNIEFRDELLFLDDEYGCINVEWESRSTPCHFGDPRAAISRIPIVHFSAVGKPWEYSTSEIRELRPDAYDIFFDLWARWRREMKAVLADIDDGAEPTRTEFGTGSIGGPGGSAAGT